MMSVTLDEQRWQTVNAYVDGELDPVAAADVAAAVARDRELASTVATIARLKAATAGSIDAPPIFLDPPLRLRWRWAALAASVVLVFGLGGAAVVHDWRAPPPRDLAKAVERHTDWVASGLSTTETAPMGPTLTGLAQLGFATEIPDLSDAGLQLAQVSVVEDRGGPVGLQVRYIGTRGCRISLVVERRAVAVAPARQDVGTVQVASWSVRDLRYTLLASGMYERRFETIAATAEAATRRDVPSVDTLRQAMRDQRGQSPPCVG